MDQLTLETLNGKIEALNKRQEVLNEQAQKAQARFGQIQQSYSQEMAALQNEFTENVGALKTLATLLPQQDGQ
jgi:chaperonin cofactor prefoldin